MEKSTFSDFVDGSMSLYFWKFKIPMSYDSVIPLWESFPRNTICTDVHLTIFTATLFVTSQEEQNMETTWIPINKGLLKEIMVHSCNTAKPLKRMKTIYVYWSGKKKTQHDILLKWKIKQVAYTYTHIMTLFLLKNTYMSICINDRFI